MTGNRERLPIVPDMRVMPTRTPNGWWMSVHTFNPGFSRGGGDYIITSSNLDYETKGGYYSDIAEAEAEIARRLASDDREITIYMGYYYGREYQLSVETLNAVKASGKTLHILFPGVEARRLICGPSAGARWERSRPRWTLL